MSLNTDNLSAHVASVKPELMSKIVGEGRLAKALIESGNFQSGVKGNAAVVKMDASVNFQDNSSCGRTALGTITLSDATIVTKPIADNKNICPKDLYGTLKSTAIAKAQKVQTGEEVSTEIYDAVLDLRAKKISLELEKLLVYGDTSLTGTTNMKYIDGIVKQTKAGAYINLSGATGSTVKERLQKAFLLMPTEERTAEDFKIFLGEDLYQEYLIDLDNQNRFTEANAETLVGTTAKLFPLAGLNGTKEVIASRLFSLQYAVDGENDEEEFSWEWSKETKQYYQDVAFVAGIKVVYPESVGYVKFS